MTKQTTPNRAALVRVRPLAPLAAALAISGCVISGPRPSGPPPTVSPSTPVIEGSWRSTENLYTASFFNNSTQWTEIGTGALLISGTYTQLTRSDYTLQLTSAVSGQTRTANCRLANLNTLNCTRDDGNQFSMVRAAGTV